MKKKIISLIEKIHFLIFRHQMSSEMKKFLGNLSWSFSIGIFVMPLSMLVATLAGRFMGPIEYGKYNLLIIIIQFLVIFIFFGLDTVSVKNIAQAKTFESRKKIISSISNYIFFALAILIILTLASYPFLVKYFQNYSLFAILAAFYTLIVSVKIMFDLFIRGLENFKKQAQAKVLEISVILVAFLLIFFVFKANNFIGYILVLSAGGITISIYYFFYLKNYLGKSNFKGILKQLGQGKLFFLSALLGTIYFSSDRLAVAKSLGVTELGIYSAYYMSSFVLISQITQLFTNVFFPASARMKDKTFANKIDKLLLFGFLPLAVLVSAIIFVMLLVFGKEYPINYCYVVGFASFSALYFFQALYGTIIIDSSREQYKKFLFIINGVNFLTILTYIIAIYLHFISIPFILIALIVNGIVSVLIERLFIRKMQNVKQ